MILVTKTFEKQLQKLKSVSLEQICMEINKYTSGLDNFIELGTIDGRVILKGYLLSKKVRVLILCKKSKGNYLPFYIVRKETKTGKNIRKESIEDFHAVLDKIFSDLEKGEYKTVI